MDLILKTVVEFRDEMREFRAETRATLAQHSHQLSVIETILSGMKVDTGPLLGSVPVQNERLNTLEARVAALDACS